MKALLAATVMVFGVSAFAVEPTTTTAPATTTATAPVAHAAPAKVEGTKMAAADKPNYKEECKSEGKTAKKDLKACIKDKKKAAKAAKEAPAAQ